MKRFIALLLVCIMLLSMAACADNTDEPVGDSTTAVENATEAEEQETEELPDFDLKNAENFNSTMTFLSFDPKSEWSVVDIYAEGESEEPIPSAIWQRNVWIKDTFGVTIEELRTDQVLSKAQAQYKGGDDLYSAYVTDIAVAATFSTKGYVYNLADDKVPHINLEKSWWDQKAVSDLKIDGKLFFVTGDILTIDNDATFIMMFNKDIVRNKSLDDPYGLVTNKEWTLEKCNQMMSTNAKDIDGDGYDYLEDQFGLAGGQELTLGFFYGTGLSTVKANESGELKFNIDVDKADDFCVWAKDNIFNSELTVVFHLVGTKNDYRDAMNCFTESRALLYGECLQCVTRMRGFEINFGIIPYPMFDQAQGQYYGYVNNVAQVVSVPTNCKNVEMTGTVLEAMAYKSKSTLTPAYYDISLIAKGTRDEESEPMLNIILANRIFDLGYVFGWGNYITTVYSCAQKGANAASQLAKGQKKFDTAMEKTLRLYAKYYKD